MKDFNVHITFNNDYRNNGIAMSYTGLEQPFAWKSTKGFVT